MFHIPRILGEILTFFHDCATWAFEYGGRLERFGLWKNKVLNGEVWRDVGGGGVGDV